jgi:hypothetical protein
MRKAYPYVSIAPPLLMVVWKLHNMTIPQTDIYSGLNDPLLILLPISSLMSLALGIAGLVLIARSRRRGQPAGMLWLWTLISSSLVLFVIVAGARAGLLF